MWTVASIAFLTAGNDHIKLKAELAHLNLLYMGDHLYVPPSLCAPISMCPCLYVSPSLCAPVSLCPCLYHIYVPLSLCAPISLFPCLCAPLSMCSCLYVPPSLCAPVSVPPSLCALVSMCPHLFRTCSDRHHWKRLKNISRIRGVIVQYSITTSVLLVLLLT